MENRNLKLDYIIGSLYWVILIVFFIYYCIYGVIEDTLIIGFSFLIFIICYIIIPVCLLTLPLFIKIKFNKKFYISVIISSITTILYVFVIVPTLQYGIKNYLSVFTIDKWKSGHQYNRYFMIEDLEKKYNFVGMTKEEIFYILGEEQINKDLVIEYYIGDGGSNSIYYNIYLNEKYEVIKTKVKLVN